MSAARALWTGLTTPSTTALASASATVFGWLALLGGGLSPDVLRDGGVGWFASSPQDDYAFVTARVLDLERQGADRPLVVVLGGSSTRESLTGEDDLEARLAARGVEVEVVDLTADAQTQIESAALLDRLPAGATGFVVYGVSANRFTQARAEMETLGSAPRLGFRSPRIDQEIVLAGGTPAPPLPLARLDPWQFWVLRLPVVPLNLVRGRQIRQQHRYLDLPHAAPGEIRMDWDVELAGLRENGAYHAEVLGRTVARLRQERPGMGLALLDGPWYEAWSPPGYDAAWAERLRSVSEAVGAPVWALDEVAALQPQDFRDPTHLRTVEAQQRYTDAVADRLAAALRPGG